MLTDRQIELIPDPIHDAVTTYNEGELERPFNYSATVLCNSPRQVQLEKRHKGEIVRTFATDWYSFFGTAFHNHVENQLKGNPRYVCEKRIVKFLKPKDYPEDCFRSVGAKFDCYDKETKTLSDHKTTTTFIHGKEMKPEWITQLNVNAYFLELEGYPVEWLCINAVYVDWRDQKYKYDRTGNYPSTPVAEFRMKAWPMEEREAHVLSILKDHVDAENIPDDELPACTEEYCWARPGQFAVYKPGASRAYRLFNTMKEAQECISYNKLSGYLIEERKSTRMRCENYCSAAPFCNQYKEYQGIEPDESN